VASRAGSPALETLLAVRRRLASAARRACPPWLVAEAEDVAQAAFLKVLTSLQGGGVAEPTASYLEKAAYSAAVDEMRRRFRRREVPEDGAFERAEPGADPERLAAAREIEGGITVCLEGLVRPRRLAVTLFLQGSSVPEVGRILGGSTKKAEHLVYRGLEQLRRCLTARGLAP
jgi:RNA polymerase sigma-70 factor (ECF subfamily)